MTLTIHLSDRQAAALQAQAQGLSIEQWLLGLADQAVHSSALPSEHKRESPPIWDVILDNMKDVPPEEFAKLPKDGASEHDHYLYGHPKRNP